MPHIDDLRQLRKQSIESHLYATAELVGDKILAMTSHHEDAYWLAQTYYGMGEYIRGAQTILANFYERESAKCRYIAALCFIKASELERAHDLLTDFAAIEQSLFAVGNSSSSFTNAPQGVPATTIPASNSVFPDFARVATPIAPKRASSGANVFSTLPTPKPRVVSSSSIKTPRQRPIRAQRVSSGARQQSHGSRQFSTGSGKLSAILPDLEDVSVEEASNYVVNSEEELNGVFLESLLTFLLGQVYTLQSKFALAKEKYIAALKQDGRCFEAFSQLIKYHALLPREEWTLLASLDFRHMENDFGKSLYALRLSALSDNRDLMESVSHLVDTYQIPPSNSDIVSALAQTAVIGGDYEQVKDKLELVIEQDPYNLRACPALAQAYYELGNHTALHKLGHKLSTTSPDSPITLFVIGVYYLATGKCVEARKFFSQCSMADPGFVPAWLCFAKTFVDECEHEQAITAYSTILKLFPGYHLPYVYIGIQHLYLQNLGLAEKYLVQATEMFDEDPLLLNELGVCYYHKQELSRAQPILEMALMVASRANSNKKIRTSILSNLGFVCRKSGNISTALDYFNQVCQESKLNAEVLSAMGMCYLQVNQVEKAVEHFNKSLFLVRDNPVTNELLKRAHAILCEQSSTADLVNASRKYMFRERVKVD